jgi:hypothetical protein
MQITLAAEHKQPVCLAQISPGPPNRLAFSDEEFATRSGNATADLHKDRQSVPVAAQPNSLWFGRLGDSLRNPRTPLANECWTAVV